MKVIAQNLLLFSASAATTEASFLQETTLLLPGYVIIAAVVETTVLEEPPLLHARKFGCQSRFKTSGSRRLKIQQNDLIKNQRDQTLGIHQDRHRRETANPQAKKSASPSKNLRRKQ